MSGADDATAWADKIDETPRSGWTRKDFDMAEPQTVGEILDSLPAAREPSRASANRGRSITVKKLGAELNRAVEIKAALAEYDDPKLILDMIEGETDLAEAACAVYEETLEDETLLAGLDATIESLRARKSRVEQSIETRRGLILMAMMRAEISTIKSPLATLSVRNVSPKTIIAAEEEIPAKFWKPQDPALDRRAVHDALKAGEAVPGAQLSNGGIALSIRVK